MPHIIKKTVYFFNELSDDAKEKARNWYRNGALDYEWWDCTFEDAKTCLALLGFTVNKIFFCGFSSQGDGACFEGSWCADAVRPLDLKSHAPKDVELHRLADELNYLALKFPQARLSVKHQGHYYHKYETAFNVDTGTEDPDDMEYPSPAYNAARKAEQETEEALIEASRDAMHWIYRQLENEYNYLNSDEQVDESIIANEYEFTKAGRRAT